ncbi:histidine acid phosphatase, partial [Colletotrichum graminicola M1.001]
SIHGQKPEPQPDRHDAEPTSHFWGSMSPFFPVPSEIDPTTPSRCKITFVQILERHGARNPNAGNTRTYKALIQRIQDVVTHYSKGFEFIKTYKYNFVPGQLTPFGQRECYDSGMSFYRRYEALAAKNDPFIRAAGQDRVIESGEKWAQGFYHSKKGNGHEPMNESQIKKLIHIIPQTEGFNNTLSKGGCPAFDKDYATLGKQAQAPWLKKFTQPIATRLNKMLPGAHLTDNDIVHLMQLCPVNTVVDGIHSQFCNLFTLEEWKDYDYYDTLARYYSFHAGNPLGPTQGVGYTNELIARLTRQPVVDHTSTNSTLTGDPNEFPLDRNLYADFSHDSNMVSVYGALGLYNELHSLSKTRRMSTAETGGFTASWMVPFAGRMYVEKMKCDGTDEEMVRVLVNDRVVPLSGCGADKLGRCKLGRFVESLGFARRGGLWHECFD